MCPFPAAPAHLGPLLFPVASIRLSFWLFPVILLSPFVLPARFPVGPTCPLCVGSGHFSDKPFLWIEAVELRGGLLAGGIVPTFPSPQPVHPPRLLQGRGSDL